MTRHKWDAIRAGEFKNDSGEVVKAFCTCVWCGCSYGRGGYFSDVTYWIAADGTVTRQRSHDRTPPCVEVMP